MRTISPASFHFVIYPNKTTYSPIYTNAFIRISGNGTPVVMFPSNRVAPKKVITLNNDGNIALANRIGLIANRVFKKGKYTKYWAP